MRMIYRIIMLTGVALLASLCMAAASEKEPRTLTLQQCRDLAIAADKELAIAGRKQEIAGYDRKSALANWFPEISATGTYQYNSRDLSLLPESVSEFLNAEGPLYDLRVEVDKALTLDVTNVFAGAVTVVQPVFMGGKIINADRMARLAVDIADIGYEDRLQQTLLSVDMAYWQTVSVAARKRLAESYSELLQQAVSDVTLLEAQGMATGSDVLSVKVKANEADILCTKADNALTLSKMFLARLCGMGTDSDFVLSDENADTIVTSGPVPERTDKEITAARADLRMLSLTADICDRRVAAVRADMLPQVVLTGSYVVTNPNMFHSFQNSFGGFFNVGVSVRIPITHGGERLQKTRKAKAEAAIMREKLAQAEEMAAMEAAQLRHRWDEAVRRVGMAGENLSAAEENLRTATVGFNEGIIAFTALSAAQTAWLQANTEYIDASIELNICSSALRKAEGLPLN